MEIDKILRHYYQLDWNGSFGELILRFEIYNQDIQINIQ